MEEVVGRGGKFVSYDDYLEEQAQEADGRPMFSQTSEHSYLAVKKIIENSRFDLRVLSKDFNDPLYITDEMVNIVTEFLTRNFTATVSVISTMEVPLSHPIYNFLRDPRFSGRVRFSVLPSEYVPTYYFIVGDGRNLRLENPVGFAEAVVAFGDTLNGKALQSRFDELQDALAHSGDVSGVSAGASAA